jgi:hypothetical protein
MTHIDDRGDAVNAPGVLSLWQTVNEGEYISYLPAGVDGKGLIDPGLKDPSPELIAGVMDIKEREVEKTCDIHL